MTNVLVTGASGFVGRNLCVFLRRRDDVSLREYDVPGSAAELKEALAGADVVFHLAGVNRPQDSGDFKTQNTGFTSTVCEDLLTLNRAPKFVFASSVQAELDNPYGKSKRDAEDVLREYARATGAVCVVYRLKNLFGKLCRPNYNSVTATFCHNIAHDLPIEISDPNRELELTYIDDVIEAFLAELAPGDPGFRYAPALQSHRVTLGELAETIRGFRQIRSELQLPDLSHPFLKALYGTYLTYLDEANFGYGLEIKADQRGNLAEFLRAPGMGQLFLSRTLPGVTRGNHYHHTKTEKFLVMQGEAMIRFRHILDNRVIEYRVRGEEYRVIDIPPGYTHSIENVGSGEMVTLFWASEMFDPAKPDTYFEPVLQTLP